jgi:hypothetical protein
MRHTLMAGAVAAAALLFAGTVPRPAEALPVSKPALTQSSGITLVRHGGRGGFRGSFGGGPKAFRGFRGGGGPKFHARKFGGGYGGFGKPHHRHRGRGIRIYPRYYGYVPYYYGDYYYDDTYYDDSCAWLRRKALRTNSRYWWRRYHRCRDSY